MSYGGQTVEFKRWKCKKCGHEWYGRKPKVPYICPKCKKYTWNEGDGV